MMYQKTKSFFLFRWSMMILIVLFAAFPVFFVLISSFKHPMEIFQYPPKFFFTPTLENYSSLGSDWPIFFKSMWQSVLAAFGSSLITILLTMPAGYALSRSKSRIINGSAFFMLAVRMYPPIVLTVPLFPIFSRLGLVDTYWVLLILYSTFFISLSSWLMKTYMDDVPVELEEAARIDGANPWQVVTRIVLPLSIHGIIATFVFVTIFAWKEYTIGFIFTGTKIRTAPLVLSEMLSPVTGVSWGPLFAAVTLQLLPIIVFIWFVQSYLVKGMRSGAVKG